MGSDINLFVENTTVFMSTATSFTNDAIKNNSFPALFWSIFKQKKKRLNLTDCDLKCLDASKDEQYFKIFNLSHRAGRRHDKEAQPDWSSFVHMGH